MSAANAASTVDILSALRARHEVEELSGFELEFAALMLELASEADSATRTALALAAALTGQHMLDGHVCVDLAQVAGTLVLGTQAPALEDWLVRLSATPVVAKVDRHSTPGSGARPLILEGSRLYLQRYWRYERELAQRLRARAAMPLMDVDRAALIAGLDRWFGPLAEPCAALDRQRLAAALVVLRPLAVISGGPGTGKTSTIARILALLVDLHAPPTHPTRPLRIALVAPTGKAAARLQESIRAAKASLAPLGLSAEMAARIPDAASTVHRLLQPLPAGVSFRFNTSNRLPIDCLILDEASMVDLALMAKLLAALPDSARLILLGDHDQLASVEAGAVLASLCARQDGYSGELCAALHGLVGPLSGPSFASANGRERSPLGDSLVLLTHSYRFRASGGIGRLARHIVQGEADAALALCEDCADVKISALRTAAANETMGDFIATLLDGYRAYLDALKRNTPIDELFAALARFRVLCAHRYGAFGAETLNRRIEAAMRVELSIEPSRGERHEWYPGRAVLVTRNDYSLRLFNGDVGIVLADIEAGGALRVFFEQPNGAVRRVSPARLAYVEPVFAMTVHKSQGSEFEAVALVLPEASSPIVTRELLYTAITRAARRVEIWSTREVLVAGIANKQQRASGLAELLWSDA